MNTMNNEPGENFNLDNDIQQYEEKYNLNKYQYKKILNLKTEF